MYTRLIVLLVGLSHISLHAISDRGFFDLQRARRQVAAHTVKANVVHFNGKIPQPPQQNNGDEQAFADLRGNFNKGLQHQVSGFPNRNAFLSMVKALSTGRNSDFLAILIGQGVFRLVSPQSSLAFSLAGNDAWLNAIPPAPTFSSAQTAGEMVELYWTALVRDVPFNQFNAGTPMSAIINLNALTDFRGPKIGGLVTSGTFLRGNTPGDLIGPYISQFLYQNVPYGATMIPPNIEVPTLGITNDFVTTFADWFQVETGGPAAGTITFEPTPTFINTPRDLSEYVHRDTPGQAALSALLILNSFGPAALDPANPYLNNPTQDGFVTFGIGQFLVLLQEAVQEGLKAAWYQKWQVNRRLRPEEYGFYVQQAITTGNSLGINSQLLNSPALAAISGLFGGNVFLPLAYPEGSPVHPSYPAGHAAFIGAAVTILKAVFNENFVIPSPVEPNLDNDALEPFVGPPLTVGNELNKLAANIALGRDHAGVHYRSDGFEGMNLGEKVAIDILNNESFLFNENFNGYTLTKFNGERITVGKKRDTF